MSHSSGQRMGSYDISSPLLAPAAGDEFLLQTGTSGDEHFCRLLDGAGVTLHQVSLSTFLLQPSPLFTGDPCGSGNCLPSISTCVPSGGGQACEVTITLSTGGTVELTTIGARATFHYARAFLHP